MRYTIVNNKMYRINDDGTLTEKTGVNLKANLLKELRQHVEKEVKEDKIKKDKEKADREKAENDNTPKNKAVIESIEPPKKKKGKRKKEKITDAVQN